MKNKGYAKVWGGNLSIRCIMGNVEVAYGVFIQSLRYAVLGEPFFPNCYEKIQEICS